MSTGSGADDGLSAFDSASENPLTRAENSSGIFKYLPLNHDNSEIRLLRIMPGSPDEKVKCNLESVAQSSAPDYKALSYAWGGLSRDHEIFVIGLNPKAGKQVFDFLEKAGGLKNIGGKEVYARLGKGAKTEELKKMGYAEPKGLVYAVAPALKEMENPPMSGEDSESLLPLVMDEAKSIGVDMP